MNNNNSNNININNNNNGVGRRALISEAALVLVNWNILIVVILKSVLSNLVDSNRDGYCQA